MKTVVIENPILNSPFEMPRRHFKFDQDKITDQIVEGRRRSGYFVPIASPKKKGRNSDPDLFPVEELKEHDDINFIRSRVDLWRDRGYPGITPVTRNLLEYWTRTDAERRQFFCRVEALETLIYLTEAASKADDDRIFTKLREAGEAAGTTLFRLAIKMATGTGKTGVMAMLIAWLTLNHRAYPHSTKFSDAFLIVAPGITIRDRLRVLLPSDPNSIYKAFDLVPPESLAELAPNGF